jgi:hypothetical protein
MQSDVAKTGRTIGTAISIMLKTYGEIYKLHDELADRVEEAGAGLQTSPWFTFEALGSAESKSCLRARLARYFVPQGSLGKPKRETAESERDNSAHLRLEPTGRTAFATVELYRADGSLPMPMVWYGVVDQFSGSFLKSGAVLVQRGDLATILDSTNFSLPGAPQPVYGRTRAFKASMRVRVWGPLAAIQNLDDVGALAKGVVAAYADPGTLERVI